MGLLIQKSNFFLSSYLSVSTDIPGTGFGDRDLDSFLLRLESVSLKRMVLPNPYLTFSAL